MRGIIGVPTTGLLPLDFIKSLFNLDMPGEVNLEFMRKSIVYAAREEMVTKMLKDHVDWLFMVDDDMVFPPDTLSRLLNHNLPVVSALCYQRYAPYNPCAWTFKELSGEPRQIRMSLIDPDKYNQNVPFCVDAVGAACLLIRRETFMKLPGPWFTPINGMGEDISFCVRCKDAGVPIMIDRSIDIGHLETKAVGYPDWRANRDTMEGAV